MRLLRYSINITVDGCCDHTAGVASKEMHQYASESLARADALIFGRVIYQMMEEAWRPVAETGVKPDWMEPWMVPFANVIHAAKKYVVSNTLQQVDWNAELVTGDLEQAVRQLKQQPGKELLVAGVTLPLALANMGLIDEFEFMVLPRIAGRGPTLLSGLSTPLDLRLVSRREYDSGSVLLKYERR